MPSGSNPFNPRPGGRRPTFRGVFQRDVTQGVERVRKWPRKRGRAKTAEQKAREDKFKWANQATKYFAPQIVADFTAAVQGTPLMPRDLLIAQMYGRLAMFVLNDGRHLWPKEASMEVSKALDVISATPGTMLIRTEQAWEGAQFDSPEQAQALLAALGGAEGDTLIFEDGQWKAAQPVEPFRVPPPARFYCNTAFANVTGDGSVWQCRYDTVHVAADWVSLNPATGAITFLEDGVYQLEIIANFNGGATSDAGLLLVYFGEVLQWRIGYEFTDEPNLKMGTSFTFEANAGTVVNIRANASGGTKTMDVDEGSFDQCVNITRLA